MFENSWADLMRQWVARRAERCRGGAATAYGVVLTRKSASTPGPLL